MEKMIFLQIHTIDKSGHGTAEKTAGTCSTLI